MLTNAKVREVMRDLVFDIPSDALHCIASGRGCLQYEAAGVHLSAKECSRLRMEEGGLQCAHPEEHHDFVPQSKTDLDLLVEALNRAYLDE